MKKFEYDTAGRLKVVKDDSGTTLETYYYGASRERLMTDIAGVGKTYYAWGGGGVICEYTEATGFSTPDFAYSYQYAGGLIPT
ncbi:MAG: hypothetical protein ABL999_16385 [Pyrinomonadaceae bacterium]